MAKSKSSHASYQDMQAELDNIMQELQRDDIDVDKALEHYQRGLELVKDLEAYLKTAENKITELKSAFNSAKE